MDLDFSQCRVAIVGDAMLDIYVDGTVNRISPEAPVAVLCPTAERWVAGGAGNVAVNVAALGGQARLIGLVGDDDASSHLTQLLANHASIRSDGLIPVPGRPTSAKTRILCGRQQIVRIDREETAPPVPAVLEVLADAVADAVAWADVVIISDYGKGVCNDAILAATVAAAKRRNTPIIVDPKRRDVAAYAGASIITPNRRELTEASGLPCESDDEAERAAGVMIAETGAAVLLTRSERGMSYFADDQTPIHLPTVAQEVFDVSGAGDTVVATFALGLARRFPVFECMRLANHSAGIVVGKIGTASTTVTELHASLDREQHLEAPRRGSLVSLVDAVDARTLWRRQGLSVGFTNGCFDLLHPGHVALLEQAADVCDRLIVAVNTDASVQRLKGPSRPLQTAADRARVLGAFAAVDLVILFEEDTPLNVVSALTPDVLIKGGDYTVETIVGAKEVLAAGGRVLVADLIPGHSTTRLVDAMVNGAVSLSDS